MQKMTIDIKIKCLRRNEDAIKTDVGIQHVFLY